MLEKRFVSEARRRPDVVQLLRKRYGAQFFELGGAKRILDNMAPQAAIAFKLVFGEELIGSGLVRERGMNGAVLRDADIFVTSDRRFEVDQIADAAVTVHDFSDGAMGETLAILLPPNRSHVDVDFGAEIGVANADEIAEIPNWRNSSHSPSEATMTLQRRRTSS